MAEAYLVLWWVEADQIPSIADAEERLVYLRQFGPTPHAFTFRDPYPAPDGTGEGSRPTTDPWSCPTS